ncbi:reverse transcriptase domain-containing protein [Tanacetum coccineum]
MNKRCSAVLLNKLPSKEKDPGGFTIPYDIGQLDIDNALADLGASISLMSYTMYKKVALGEPKATRMNFVILDMPEDSRVPIILRRLFLATAQAMIDVFNKKITLRVRDDEVVFDVDQSIKKPTTEDDECYGIDDLDETINEEAQELLTNKEPDSFLSRGLEKSIDQSDLECCKSTSSDEKNGFDSKHLIRRINSINTPYPVTHRTTNGDVLKANTFHLYRASANEIDEKKPELKNLPQHLEYTYLHGDKSFPIIISSELSETEKISLLQILYGGDDLTTGVIQPPKWQSKPESPRCCEKQNCETTCFELIYPISDSSWVSHIHVVPKKEGMTVVLNDNNELIPSRIVTGWRVCIDYRFFQIPIAPEDQEKTTFTCPYRTFAYRRMPFGLCNAPATFQRCMTAIFHDMVEDFIEVFVDDFSVFGNYFDCCLANLDRMLARCEETNLVLNWEKCYFMVKEGLVLGHKISRAGIEVDKEKIDVIAKLPYPTNVKGVRSFLGHAGFYRRFIKDFSMISKLMTQLLMKDAKFDFSNDCKKAFNILKEKLTTAPIIISPDWNEPFELMCDASDFAVGAVLGQRINRKFKLIYYAIKTLNNAQEHYTTTEKELLAVVFSFDKFRQYLILSKTVVYTDYSALKYLFSKEDAKLRLIRWVLLIKGFDIEIKDKKGAENLAADHLSRLENPNLGTFLEEEITDEFPDKHLMMLKAELNNDEPWYADYINYIVGNIIPPNWTPKKRRRLFSQVKYYFWDEPYAFNLCSDNVMRRCVVGNKILDILAHCHSGPTRGHHSASTTGRKVYKSRFYWPNIFKDAKNYVMKVPKALISDRGTLFCNSQLEKALQNYGVAHKLSTAYHPQTNRHTKVTNRAIKCIPERSVGYNLKNWSEKLDDALWAFITAYKTPTGCTPFRLVYGKACHLPVEIKHKAYYALIQCNMDLTAAAKNHFMELNDLMKLRDEAYENTQIYKERTKKWHDSRLRGNKNFKEGDKVLIFNSRFKMHPGKLKSKWYDPCVVKTVHPYGTVEIIDKNGVSFKVNGQRLKKYHDGHINEGGKEVVELDDNTT